MAEDYTELIPNEVTEDHQPKDWSEPSDASANSAGGPAAGGQTVGDVWILDGRGRMRLAGTHIYQRGDETPEQARARAQRPKDRKPRRAKTTKKLPPVATNETDLRKAEEVLVEILSSPAAIAAMAGSPWGADHFTNQAPVFARNIVATSEHNLWLRRKLEILSTGGGDLAMQLAMFLPLVASAISYALPPIVFYLHVPVPDDVRRMFGIPEPPPPYADAAPAAYSAAA